MTALGVIVGFNIILSLLSVLVLGYYCLIKKVPNENTDGCSVPTSTRRATASWILGSVRKA